MPTTSNELRPLAEHAADLVTDGMVVGLGTGHAAIAFIHVLGERVRAGLRTIGVPTSRGSERLAIEIGFPLTTLYDVTAIDIDFDGADEVDPRGNLIKGYGGALLREKIIAAASRQIVILVGEEKLVPALGSHGKLPVEVTPVALGFCQRRLKRRWGSRRNRGCTMARSSRPTTAITFWIARFRNLIGRPMPSGRSAEFPAWWKPVYFSAWARVCSFSAARSSKSGRSARNLPHERHAVHNQRRLVEREDRPV